MLPKIFILILSLCYCSVNLNAQDLQSLDTTCENWKPHFKDFVAPAALVTTGILLSIDYKNGINQEIHRWTKNNQHHCHIDYYARFLPSAAYLSIGELGINARHALRDRLAVFMTSHAAMSIIGYGFKGIVSEQRPDLSDNHSFPSGHVALAFTGAELMREEYGMTCGIVGYAVASSVAVMRLYNNRHWLGDVLTGAGIGILSARVGYWLLPYEKRLLGWNKKEPKTIVSTIPAYNAHSHSWALAVVAQF